MPAPARSRPLKKDFFSQTFKGQKPVVFSENARPSTIPPHIRHLAWSSTGAALATTSGSKVRIWNPDRPNVKSSQELLGHVGSVEKLVWNPTREGEIATTGNDGTVKLWDVRVGPGAHNKAVPVKEIALGDGGLFLAWSPTGQHLVAGRRDDVIVPIDVRMGAMGNTEDLTMQEGRKLGSAQTNQMAFSNSGREVFATTGEGTVKVLDWPSMVRISLHVGHNTRLTSYTRHFSTHSTLTPAPHTASNTVLMATLWLSVAATLSSRSGTQPTGSASTPSQT